MTNNLPAHLIAEIQKYTGGPWWNGPAYMGFKGYSQKMRTTEREVGATVEELAGIIDQLRAAKMFDKADQLRTIAGRLARLLHDDDASRLAVQAKSWK